MQPMIVRLLAAREMRAHADRLDALADVVDLGVGDVGASDDDHESDVENGGENEKRPVEFHGSLGLVRGVLSDSTAYAANHGPWCGSRSNSSNSGWRRSCTTLRRADACEVSGYGEILRDVVRGDVTGASETLIRAGRSFCVRHSLLLREVVQRDAAQMVVRRPVAAERLHVREHRLVLLVLRDVQVACC